MNVQDVPRRGDELRQRGPDRRGHGRAGAAQARHSRGFLGKLFGLAVPEDLERYSAEELADIAETFVVVLAERQSGVAKIRFEPVSPERRGGARNRQRRHAVPGRFRRRRTESARSGHPPVRPSGLCRRARSGRPARQLQGRAHGRRPSRKLHPYSHRRRRQCGAAGRNRPRARRHSLRCARQRAGLEADAVAHREHHRRPAQQPAAASGRRDRRSDPVSGMDRRR